MIVSPNHRYRRCVSAKKGFTIVELLVVILVIGALISFSMPAIVGMRKKAQDVAKLSDLRQHAQVFIGYTGDHRDRFPFYMDPDAMLTVLRHEELSIARPYWTGFGVWNIALAEYYENDPRQRIFHPSRFEHFYDGSDFRYAGTGYMYSHVFVSRPQFWKPETRLGDDSQRGPTGYTEVAFPGDKGLHLDQFSYPGSPVYSGGSRGSNIGFCDGSARSVIEDRLLPSYPGGVGVQTWPGEDVPFLVPSGPVMATLDGVLGRDVR